MWTYIVLFATAGAIWCRIDGFSIEFTLHGIEAAAMPAIAYLLLRRLLIIRFPKLVLPVQALAQFIMIGIACEIIQYPAASAARPTLDAQMIAFDRRLGIDWLTLAHFVWSHAALADVLRVSYGCLIPQVIPLVFLVGLLDPPRLAAFMRANAVCQTMVVAASAIWPVGGAFYALGFATSSNYTTQFEAVRAGTIRLLTIDRLTGIVQFPSYHAMLAAIVMWTVARLPWWLSIPICLFETVIIASAPVMGGHHIADIAAGLVAGAVAMAFAHGLGCAAVRRISYALSATPAAIGYDL